MFDHLLLLCHPNDHSSFVVVWSEGMRERGRERERERVTVNTFLTSDQMPAWPVTEACRHFAADQSDIDNLRALRWAPSYSSFSFSCPGLVTSFASPLSFTLSSLSLFSLSSLSLSLALSLSLVQVLRKCVLQLDRRRRQLLQLISERDCDSGRYDGLELPELHRYAALCPC